MVMCLFLVCVHKQFVEPYVNPCCPCCPWPGVCVVRVIRGLESVSSAVHFVDPMTGSSAAAAVRARADSTSACSQLPAQHRQPLIEPCLHRLNGHSSRSAISWNVNPWYSFKMIAVRCSSGSSAMARPPRGRVPCARPAPRSTRRARLARELDEVDAFGRLRRSASGARAASSRGTDSA